jgi:3D (Asp-Asp-Asp) domain-containing protein
MIAHRARRIAQCAALLAAMACDGGDDTSSGANANAGASGRGAGGGPAGTGGSAGTGGNATNGGSTSGGVSNGGSTTGGATTSGGAATSGGVTNAGGTSGASSGGASGAGGSADAGQSSPGALLGTFQLTYYWVTAEEDFAGAQDTTLYDDSCGTIAMVRKAFADALAIEGTGRLSDGRVVNVSGSCACPSTTCYVLVDAQHPWGVGARSNALVPFRSIAVDRNVIALGSHVYVAEFDGVTMPGDASYGQFVHDGCVSADDVGGGIVGQHIDFFAALEAHYRTLDGQLNLNSVTVYQGGQRCP